MKPKGGYVQGVALSKGSPITKKPAFYPLEAKAHKPYANQSRSKAAGKMKG